MGGVRWAFQWKSFFFSHEIFSGTRCYNLTLDVIVFFYFEMRIPEVSF